MVDFKLWKFTKRFGAPCDSSHAGDSNTGSLSAFVCVGGSNTDYLSASGWASIAELGLLLSNGILPLMLPGDPVAMPLLESSYMWYGAFSPLHVSSSKLSIVFMVVIALFLIM